MSEVVTAAIEGAIATLREARDALPRRDAYECVCGNLMGPHGHARCGTPTTAWSSEAWDLEYAARKLESAWLQPADV